MTIYFTLSSLTREPGEPVHCLCGAFGFPDKAAAYFDCNACGQRWWTLAPGMMLKQIERARSALA